MHKQTQKERAKRIYKVRQDNYVPGAKEKDLLIYTRLQEDYNLFSQELIQKILNLKNGLHPLFIGSRRNPKIAPGRVQK